MSTTTTFNTKGQWTAKSEPDSLSIMMWVSVLS
jgi:hypothetical protein